MSLIHEALRKARREASHQDDPGVVFPGGLTGRGRKSGLGAGVVLGIVVTVATAIIIGGVLWWALRQTPGETTLQADSAGRKTAGSSVSEAETTLSSMPGWNDEHPIDSQSDPGRTAESDGTPDRETEAADSRGAMPTIVAVQDLEVETAEAAPTPVTRQTRTSGERVFLVDADLGYATLSLDYIMVSTTDRFAEINGLEVRVGDYIEGFTVEEITEDRVKLRDDMGPLLLKVPPSP